MVVSTRSSSEKRRCSDSSTGFEDLPLDLLLRIARIALVKDVEDFEDEQLEAQEQDSDEDSDDGEDPALSVERALVSYVGRGFSSAARVMECGRLDSDAPGSADALVAWLFQSSSLMLDTHANFSDVLERKGGYSREDAVAIVAVKSAIRWFPLTVVKACFDALRRDDGVDTSINSGEREHRVYVHLTDEGGEGGGGSLRLAFEIKELRINQRCRLLCDASVKRTCFRSAVRRDSAPVMKTLLDTFAVDAEDALHFVAREKHGSIETAVMNKSDQAVRELLSAIKNDVDQRNANAVIDGSSSSSLARAPECALARTLARLHERGSLDIEIYPDIAGAVKSGEREVIAVAVAAYLHNNIDMVQFMERNFSLKRARVLAYAHSRIGRWDEVSQRMCQNERFVEACLEVSPGCATETVIKGFERFAVYESTLIPNRSSMETCILRYARLALKRGALCMGELAAHFLDRAEKHLEPTVDQLTLMSSVLSLDLERGDLPPSKYLSAENMAKVTFLVVYHMPDYDCTDRTMDVVYSYLRRRVLDPLLDISQHLTPTNEINPASHTFRQTLDELCTSTGLGLDGNLGIVGMAAIMNEAELTRILLTAWRAMPFLDSPSRYEGSDCLVFKPQLGPTRDMLVRCFVACWKKRDREGVPVCMSSGGKASLPKYLDLMQPCTMSLLEVGDLGIRGLYWHPQPGKRTVFDGVPVMLVLALRGELATDIISVKQTVDWCSPYLKAASDDDPFPSAIALFDKTHDRRVLREVLSRRDLPDIWRTHTYADLSTDTVLTWMARAFDFGCLHFWSRPRRAHLNKAMRCMQRMWDVDALAATRPLGNTMFHHMLPSALCAFLEDFLPWTVVVKDTPEKRNGRRQKHLVVSGKAALNRKNDAGRTAFWQSIANLPKFTPGDVKTFSDHLIPLNFLRKAKQAKAALDEADHDGTTPLILACERGFFEAATTLVSYAANVNATERSTGNTPLLASVKYILRHEGASTSKLICADAFRQRVSPCDFVEFELLRHPEMRTVNQADKSGKTALTHLCEWTLRRSTYAYPAPFETVVKRLIEALIAAGASH